MRIQTPRGVLIAPAPAGIPRELPQFQMIGGVRVFVANPILSVGPRPAYSQARPGATIAPDRYLRFRPDLGPCGTGFCPGANNVQQVILGGAGNGLVATDVEGTKPGGIMGYIADTPLGRLVSTIRGATVGCPGGVCGNQDTGGSGGTGGTGGTGGNGGGIPGPISGIVGSGGYTGPVTPRVTPGGGGAT